MTEKISLCGLFKRCLFLLLVFLTFSTRGQGIDPGVIVKNFNDYGKNVFQEKLFVHTDRSFYLTGEYLWFKIYEVDASLHQTVDLSKIAYVELIDQNKTAVLQAKISMEAGTGYGSLFIPASVSTGSYVFRAYTRWMQNFDPGFYFHKEVTIVNPFKSRDLSNVLPSSNQYDAQFFPEGGSLVKGLKSRVGFRIVNSSGKGIDFRGVVINDKGEEVVSFRPLRFGIGNFEFTPTTQGYKAQIKDLTGKIILAKDLPVIQDDGFVMHLTSEGEQIRIAVNANGSSNSVLHLVAQGRGTLEANDTRRMEQGGATFTIEKKKLVDGISHFTIFNETGQPVCERLFFKTPEKTIVFNVEVSGGSFLPRTRVDVALSIKNETGTAAPADLSISVFKVDSLQGSDDISITSSLLLASDLQGNIESPDFYLSSDSLAIPALDNLMLTHGWRRFRWRDVMQPKPLDAKYSPELKGHILMGRVTEPGKRDSVPGIITYLSIPGDHYKFASSRSNAKGIVRFEMLRVYGPSKIIIQPDLRKDSAYRVQIMNPFSERFGDYNIGTLVLKTSHEKLLIEKSTAMQAENIYFGKIRSRVVTTMMDTLPFYHIPDEKYFLDRYTRFPTMEDVLREYVPGIFVRKKDDHFHFSLVDRGGAYAFKDDPLILLDGVPIFNPDEIMAYDPLRVKKLEVVTRRYYFGVVSFAGIASFKTYKGDLADFTPNRNVVMENYRGVEWEREYFTPVYENSEQRSNHLPDLRNLLMWMPHAKAGTDGIFKATLYTSDQPGKYIGIINARSGNGRVGNSSFTFQVVEPSK